MAHPVGNPAFDDLTARARIRDAALRLFAERGVDGATIPDITADPRAYAAVLVAMQVGPLVMHDHLSRALGADILTPAGSLRMGRAMIDLHSHSLLSSELAAQAHAAYDRLQASPHTAAEPSSATQGARR